MKTTKTTPATTTYVDEGKCQCCGCGCTEPATGTDDGGVAVCDECSEYTVDESGEVICARMTAGFERCHRCDSPIDWGHIETHGCGAANSRAGTCGCGRDAWIEEDRGGWGHYGYGPPTSTEA